MKKFYLALVLGLVALTSMASVPYVRDNVVSSDEQENVLLKTDFIRLETGRSSADFEGAWIEYPLRAQLSQEDSEVLKKIPYLGFDKLIDEVRSRYQYILIDTPPVNLVADTSIIESHVDRTVFVIRAGLLERSMLHTLEADYRANRLKNMALVLNATQVNASGNGYRQGYKYGYGYGYHSSGSDNAYYSKD